MINFFLAMLVFVIGACFIITVVLAFVYLIAFLLEIKESISVYKKGGFVDLLDFLGKILIKEAKDGSK